MKAIQLISAFIIHVVIPLAGLRWFLRLKKQMEAEKIPNAPIVELFIIFSTYGGLVLVTLTAFFGVWSGMASIGTFYLVLGAPIVMGIIAILSKPSRTISKYHNWTYLSGVLYFAIAPITLALLFFIITYLEDHHGK